MSVPAVPAFSVLAAPFPMMVLLAVLPVPLIADVPVSVRFSTFAASAAEGVASTITEPGSDAPNFAHQSEVCIAKPQTNCGDATYEPAEFPELVTFTFKVADDALQAKGKPKYTITQVFHNSSTPLPKCSDPGGLTNADGCVDSITAPKGPGIKTWTIVTKAKTNGPWNW